MYEVMVKNGHISHFTCHYFTSNMQSENRTASVYLQFVISQFPNKTENNYYKHESRIRIRIMKASMCLNYSTGRANNRIDKCQGYIPRALRTALFNFL